MSRCCSWCAGQLMDGRRERIPLTTRSRREKEKKALSCLLSCFPRLSSPGLGDERGLQHQSLLLSSDIGLQFHRQTTRGRASFQSADVAACPRPPTLVTRHTTHTHTRGQSKSQTDIRRNARAGTPDSPSFGIQNKGHIRTGSRFWTAGRPAGRDG